MQTLQLTEQKTPVSAVMVSPEKIGLKKIEVAQPSTRADAFDQIRVRYLFKKPMSALCE